MAGFLSNPGNLLQALGAGLLTAGARPEDRSQVGMQALGNFQNMMMDQRRQKERDFLLNLEISDRARANQEREEAKRKQQEQEQAYKALLGGQAPANGLSQAQFGGAPQTTGPLGNLSDAQRQFLQAAGPQAGMGVIGQQLFQEPKQRAGVNIGGVLVDPITGQQIADYSDVIRQNAAAGRSQTNINMPGNPTPDDVGREAFAEANAKSQAKYFDDVATAGSQAQVRLGEIRQLSQLLANTPTGAGQDFVNTLAAWGQRVGVDTSDLANLPAAEAAQSIVSRLAPTMRPAGSGSTSDIEVRMFMQALPSLTNTAGGNAVIASNLLKIAERSMAEGDIAVKVQSGELQPAEGRKAIQSLGPLNLELPKLNATKPGAMMPDGALNSARNRKTGSEIYLYQDDQGGYFWGDAQRNPVQ